MASGFARGAHARGKRVAFGDGKQIIWDHHSEMVFSNNPNIAKRGAERIPRYADMLEWVPFYRGSRMYNKQAAGRWIWNMDYRAKPGELYFTIEERAWAGRIKPGFVVVEPNVPERKSVAPNKQWPVDRYQRVVKALLQDGHRIVQFVYGPGHALEGVTMVKTPTFRHAAAVLARASLYIGPEGGLHHAAAADKYSAEGGSRFAGPTPAIVLFGGFIPPQVTGYDMHTNLTGGAEACGSLAKCEHCMVAMKAIGSPEVIGPALKILKRAA